MGTVMNDLDEAILSAHGILTATMRRVGEENREVAGIVVLFSGGNDSTVLTHLMRHRATHAAHANTTIGIEQTRQFVRDTCAAWDLPLIEHRAPISYRDLVLERGFPGPAQHFKMYQRLKERALRLVRKELVQNGHRQRVIFVAGRRRAESSRRSGLPEMDRDGAIQWCSPLIDWTPKLMNDYRERFPEVPRNEVSDLLHMSGECLCGAFATKGEIDEIELWFPEVAAEIHALEAELLASGVVNEERCVWGWGAYRDDVKRSKSGPLCSSCEFRQTSLDFA